MIAKKFLRSWVGICSKTILVMVEGRNHLDKK